VGVKISKGNRRKILAIGVLIGTLALGVILGWLIRNHTEPNAAVIKAIRENPTDYQFIDPVLLLQVPEDTSTPQFQSLKQSIVSYITQVKSQNKATDISVYFRELNTDQWVGINENDQYSPASMLKVVTLIAYLRAVQQDPTLYTKEITITSNDANENVNQDFYPPANPVQVGQTYSAADLLSYMIIDSDNTAANALNNEIGENAFDKTLADLQLPIPSSADPSITFSPKMYARIFRSLYNGAYLSDDISNQALELMSKTTFTQGLVAGVPNGTIVSHKFGERTITMNGQTTHELHDCGIVYAPHDPYLLCVMTKGTDFPALQKVISSISALVWSTAPQLHLKNKQVSF
jgi:beta-lactamase class A